MSNFLKYRWFEGSTSMTIGPSYLYIFCESIIGNHRFGYFVTEWVCIVHIISTFMASLSSDEIWSIFEGSRRNWFCARCALILGNFRFFLSSVNQSTNFVLAEISNSNIFYWKFGPWKNQNKWFWFLVTFGFHFIWQKFVIYDEMSRKFFSWFGIVLSYIWQISRYF